MPAFVALKGQTTSYLSRIMEHQACPERFHAAGGSRVTCGLELSCSWVEAEELSQISFSCKELKQGRNRTSGRAEVGREGKKKEEVEKERAEQGNKLPFRELASKKPFITTQPRKPIYVLK
ncbi:hypothetical protein TNCV_2452851 [Trichonephila clavipes]|nr:hypothetical protein TNCV_2452851 [Trichonephila clavipes]